MDKMVFFVSDCCYVESDPDYGICSRCGEHCEMVVDDSIHASMVQDFIGTENLNLKVL